MMSTSVAQLQQQCQRGTEPHSCPLPPPLLEGWIAVRPSVPRAIAGDWPGLAVCCPFLQPEGLQERGTNNRDRCSDYVHDILTNQ